jgi:hypothetical protein
VHRANVREASHQQRRLQSRYLCCGRQFNGRSSIHSVGWHDVRPRFPVCALVKALQLWQPQTRKSLPLGGVSGGIASVSSPPEGCSSQLSGCAVCSVGSSSLHDTTCGFLLFNTLTLAGSVTVSWAQIASTLDRIRRGLDTYKDNLTALQSWKQNYMQSSSWESKPAAIKLFRKSTPAVRLARGVAYLMIGITTVVLVPTVAGTIAVLATSLLGLPFFHLTLVLIAGGVLLLWAAKQYDHKYVQEPRDEKYRWHVALKMFAIEGFPLKNSAPLIWTFSALQVCQGLGIFMGLVPATWTFMD